MKRFTSLLVILVVLCLSSSLFASGAQLTGIGARATALGGNYRAVANDWSAMYWNPAGIAQIQGKHFGLSNEMLLIDGKYTFAQNNALPFAVFRTGEINNEPKTYLIPAAGFVYGGEKLSFGLSVYAPFGLGAQWDALDTEAYNPDYPAMDFDDDLMVLDIHPTVAFKVNDKLSVGVGFSFVMADIMIRMPKTTPNPLLADPANAALAQGVLGPMGLAADVYNYVLTDTELEGTGTGFGFNFGLKFDVNEDLSLGVSGSWYNDVPLDGKLSATTYYATADPNTLAALTGTLDQLIAINQMDQATKMQVLGVYSGTQNVVMDQAEGDADLPLPMTIGAGLAYKGINKTLVTADVSWTQWSSWDVIEVAMKDGSTQEVLTEWVDGLRVGLGLEYAASDPLTLRLGYYTEPSAIPNNTMDISIPDPSRRHGINIGASYDLGMFDLFASYERIILSDHTVEDWTLSETMDSFENLAGEYGVGVNTFMLGIGLDF